MSKKGKNFLKQFRTADAFIIQFNPDYCRNRYIAIQTSKEALYAQTIQLRELALCYDQETIQLWLCSWLYQLSVQMDFEITESQAEETAQEIFRTLYMVNITELTIFFRKLKAGQYSIFYGKFNMQTILIGAREYRQERGREIAKLSTKEQQKLL